LAYGLTIAVSVGAYLFLRHRDFAVRAVTLRSHDDGTADREDAWDAVHEALPVGWTVGMPGLIPGVTDDDRDPRTDRSTLRSGSDGLFSSSDVRVF